jgi:LysR family transcriptional activator of nhaA
MVAREGGLAPAAAKLRLSPPTLSAQINALESSLGEELFQKEGRRLVLTETGQVAYRYAEEIFSLGRELLGAVRGGSSNRPLRLAVGVGQSVPKLIAMRILEPLQKMAPKVQLICREEPPERLLAELAIHALDVVLTDAPSESSSSVKVFNHLLGESPLAIFGGPELLSAYRPGFPESLDGAPFLMPTAASATRRALEAWFDELGVRPTFVASSMTQRAAATSVRSGRHGSVARRQRSKRTSDVSTVCIESVSRAASKNASTHGRVTGGCDTRRWSPSPRPHASASFANRRPKSARSDEAEHFGNLEPSSTRLLIVETRSEGQRGGRSL